MRRFFKWLMALTLALSLVRKSSGRVDGLVIEGPAAGGRPLAYYERMTHEQPGDQRH